MVASHGRRLHRRILVSRILPDRLCSLDPRDGARRRMTASDLLRVVERGDHSLVVSKKKLKARGVRQEEIGADSQRHRRFPAGAAVSLSRKLVLFPVHHFYPAWLHDHRSPVRLHEFDFDGGRDHSCTPALTLPPRQARSAAAPENWLNTSKQVDRQLLGLARSNTPGRERGNTSLHVRCCSRRSAGFRWTPCGHHSESKRGRPAATSP